MRILLTAIALLLISASVVLPAKANTCTAKRVKTNKVCGIVQDGSNAPIKGATVQIVSADGKPLSSSVVTNADGHFQLTETVQGDAFLAVTAAQHNPLRWPIRITTERSEAACKKPLTVHLAGCLGCGCGDWVAKK